MPNRPRIARILLFSGFALLLGVFIFGWSFYLWLSRLTIVDSHLFELPTNAVTYSAGSWVDDPDTPGMKIRSAQTTVGFYSVGFQQRLSNNGTAVLEPRTVEFEIRVGMVSIAVLCTSLALGLLLSVCYSKLVREAPPQAR